MSVFVGILKGEHDDQLGWPLLELDVLLTCSNGGRTKNTMNGQ